MEFSEIDSTLIRRLPFSYAKRFSLLPVRREDGAVIVASSRPDEFQPIDLLRHLLNSPVRPVFMEEKALLDLINRVYHEAATSEEGTMVIEDVSEVEETRDLLESDDEAPVVGVVNDFLSQCLEK